MCLAGNRPFSLYYANANGSDNLLSEQYTSLANVHVHDKATQGVRLDIDALIKEKQFENAKQVFEQAKMQGLAEEKLDVLETQLTPSVQVKEPKLALQNKSLSFTQKRN